MTQTTDGIRRRLDSTDMARVGVFAALIAVLGLLGKITIAGAVPITAQTLGVMLAGAILGPWLGALSVTVVLVLVAVGVPLLSGGRGGLGVFAGPSAGYLIGWIVGAIVIGLIVNLGSRRPVWWRTLIATLVGGIAVVYAFGIPVQALIMRQTLGQTALTSLAFIPGDLIKAVICTIIVTTLVKVYPRAFRRAWVVSGR